MSGWEIAAVFGLTFAACAVEAVEALTVVVAIGVTRGWRSTWFAVGAGVALLAVVVAVFGPALAQVPLQLLRLVVGVLLLVFGLQWLRKAVLRAAGILALHDEVAIFGRTSGAARGGPAPVRGSRIDGYSFTVVFKAVVLEGLEVAFIVVTVGAAQRATGLAVAAAVAAVLAVAAVGLAVRAPLARVPENTMKFAVGVLLTTFGLFWAGEGIGSPYPGGDGFLPVLLVFVLAAALASTAALRRSVAVRP
jgi:uncharacterized membrane protein